MLGSLLVDAVKHDGGSVYWVRSGGQKPTLFWHATGPVTPPGADPKVSGVCGRPMSRTTPLTALESRAISKTKLPGPKESQPSAASRRDAMTVIQSRKRRNRRAVPTSRSGRRACTCRRTSCGSGAVGPFKPGFMQARSGRSASLMADGSRSAVSSWLLREQPPARDACHGEAGGPEADQDRGEPLPRTSFLPQGAAPAIAAAALPAARISSATVTGRVRLRHAGSAASPQPSRSACEWAGPRRRHRAYVRSYEAHVTPHMTVHPSSASPARTGGQ